MDHLVAQLIGLLPIVIPLDNRWHCDRTRRVRDT